MSDPASFTIKVNNTSYIIKPYCEVDCTLYEVFTNCEKLFTLKKGRDDSWKTDEDDIIPISESLVQDIGDALDEYEFQFNPSDSRDR
jgi:hypothetical protein